MSVFVVAVLIQQPHSLGTIVFLNHRKSRSTSQSETLETLLCIRPQLTRWRSLFTRLFVSFQCQSRSLQRTSF